MNKEVGQEVLLLPCFLKPPQKKIILVLVFSLIQSHLCGFAKRINYKKLVIAGSNEIASPIVCRSCHKRKCLYILYLYIVKHFIKWMNRRTLTESQPPFFCMYWPEQLEMSHYLEIVGAFGQFFDLNV